MKNVPSFHSLVNVCVQGCVGLSVREGSVEVVVCLPTPPPGLWASPGGAPGCTEAGCVAVGPSVVHVCFPLCPLLTFPLSVMENETLMRWKPSDVSTEMRHFLAQCRTCLPTQNLLKETLWNLSPFQLGAVRYVITCVWLQMSSET